MPLHRIYYPTGFFTPADKEALAKNITSFYTDGLGLPAFYVGVIFFPIERENYFFGGVPADKFVRINILHIARTMDKPMTALFFARYESIIAPFIKDRGMDWEVDVQEGERDLWRENGLVPPLAGTDAEKAWVAANKAILY